jgi:hypothetical protein
MVGDFKNSPWFNILNYGLETIGIHYSSYRAFVHDNNDPENLGRLQLLVPHLNESSPDQTWAFPKNQWGGKDYGVQMLPQKGDMVFVEYEYGNPDYPVWSHAGYGENEKPAEFSSPYHYGFKTPNGTLIVIDDTDDAEEIMIKLVGGNDWIKITKDQLETESKLIKLGKNGDEPGVLGDTLKGKLDDILEKLDNTHQILISHTHPTNSGPSGPPVQAAQFSQVKTGLSEIKSSLTEILSKKVKIDK